MSFLEGFKTQKLKNQTRDLKNAYSHINKMSHERDDLLEEIEDYDLSVDKRRCDLEARMAREEYLMDLLDQAYGKDKNPARQKAYEDDVDFRIPVGNRKGHVVTHADHVYLEKYAEVYNASFARKWKDHAKSWAEFLHERISI